MSVQKRSLIGSRPAEKKSTTKPVKETEAIGGSKTLAANALRRKGATHGFAFTAAKRKR